MKEKITVRKWNLFDVFLILLIVLAGLSVYFTFVKPIHFSNLIEREGVQQYAEVEILLPDDLNWMRDVIPLGFQSRGVYGQLNWEILGFRDVPLAGKNRTSVRLKLITVKDGSGKVRFGKYPLIPGGGIILNNSQYVLEGRIFRIKLLDEKRPI